MSSHLVVVGIGASAGGIKAVKEFLTGVPSNSGMAYVVILHLSPQHESRLAEVLQGSTPMPVAQVTETVAVRPDHVYVVPVHEIAPLLVRLLHTPAGGETEEPTSSLVEVEVKIAAGQNAVDAGVEEIGEPSRFACPECHGVLLRLKDQGPSRFRCHTGHAYSSKSLTAAVNDGIEDALWTAVRALEEGALLMQQLSAEARSHGASVDADDLRRQAAEAHQHSEIVRKVGHLRAAVKTSE